MCVIHVEHISSSLVAYRANLQTSKANKTRQPVGPGRGKGRKSINTNEEDVAMDGDDEVGDDDDLDGADEDDGIMYDEDGQPSPEAEDAIP